MRRIATILGIVVILVVLIALAIPVFVNANQFRPALEAKLSQSLGREVKVGNLSLSVLSGSVAADQLSISDDPAFGTNPFVRAQNLKVGVEVWPLITSRKLSINGIAIDKPEIELVQNAAGVWNFSRLGASSPPKPAPRAALAPDRSGADVGVIDTEISDVKISDLKITDGRVTMRRLGSKAKPVVMDGVGMEVKNFSEGSSFPFTLAAALPPGGSLKMNGNAGPINAEDAIDTPFDAKLSVGNLDAVAWGIVDPSTDISGMVSMDATAKSQGGVVAINGKLKAEQLKLAKGATPAKRPVDVDFAVTDDLKKLIADVRRADIHTGSATATLTGTIRSQTEPATLQAKLAGSNMPVTDLAALLPALDIVLPRGASIEGGTAQVNVISQGPLNALVTTGTVGFENTRLANYDLAGKMKVIEALSAIKAEPHTTIQTLSASFKNSPAGTAVDNVQLVVPSIGQMAGAGTISPSHALDFRMRVNVNAAAATLASAGLKGGIPFSITGTSEDPSFRPDIKGAVQQELENLTKGAGPASGIAGPASGIIDSLFGGKKKK
ncbi:MAG: AsmA family protein [Bryobacterales bacterium]|nr:AsmA family protein [Bryobacterales bacterium]MBV9400482.1 AsmA family protein [Bryobacterales bacterium]